MSDTDQWDRNQTPVSNASQNVYEHFQRKKNVHYEKTQSCSKTNYYLNRLTASVETIENKLESDRTTNHHRFDLIFEALGSLIESHREINDKLDKFMKMVKLVKS